MQRNYYVASRYFSVPAVSDIHDLVFARDILLPIIEINLVAVRVL